MSTLRVLKPRASGFNPKSIAGLAFWLDASDSSTITTATGVSQWRDKSANAYAFTQSTGNNQPALTSAGQNGRNTITFDGSSDKLVSPAGLSLSSTHSVFVVVNPRVRKIAPFLVGSVNTGLFYGDGSSSFSGTKFAAYGVSRAVYGGGTITTGVYQVFTAVCSGATLPTDLSMWTNGTGGAATTATAGTAPTASLSSPISVGAFEASQYWDGAIGEIVVYSSALATSQRQAVERYLGKKWGIVVA